jgi:hypothetical protein
MLELVLREAPRKHVHAAAVDIEGEGLAKAS